jgi:hypothetical protein
MLLAGPDQAERPVRVRLMHFGREIAIPGDAWLPLQEPLLQVVFRQRPGGFFFSPFLWKLAIARAIFTHVGRVAIIAISVASRPFAFAAFRA